MFMDCRWLVILITLVGAVQAPAVAAKESKIDESRIHKLKMPGTFDLALARGEYQCWYFWEWKSKGVETKKRTTIDVSIYDDRGHIVKALMEGERDFGSNIDLKGRSGRQEFIFKAIHPGHFRVICRQECVLAIVPSDSAYFYMFADTQRFASDDNDLHFDRENHLNRKRK